MVAWLLNQRWVYYGKVTGGCPYVVLAPKGWTGLACLSDAVNRFNIFTDFDPGRASAARSRIAAHILAKAFE